MLGGLVILCLVGCGGTGDSGAFKTIRGDCFNISDLRSLSGKTAMGPNDMLKSEEYIHYQTAR